ncbi:MAG: YjgN family protein [Leptothrix ochracea]|uniref:YjgN family protein n=1 Tax=Leptothrix ochracea TaxID=735331 RepID=UPI0034E1A3BE
MKIRFTASGSEYFRIWIVNLLLTVVTLGLYWPFAKARKLRYFHENTLVGDSPLSFHGDPKRMLRGYVLMGVLGGVYTVLNNTHPDAAAVMVVLTLPLAPWFLWSALRFRVANTGWRGLRLQFDGTLKQMYRLFVPMVTPLGVAAVGWVVLLVVGAGGGDGGESVLKSTPATIWGFVTLLCFFASMLMSIRLMWRLKEFQHSHYRLGDEVTRLEATLKDYDKVQIRIVGVVFLGSLISSSLTAILVMSLGPWAGPLGVIGLYATMLVVVGYRMARMQNLIWGGTRSEHIVFHSELLLHPLVKLMLKSAVLTVITFGFYWPFAAVALTRMRLEAISLDLSIPLEQLMGSMITQPGAAGEAAADLNPLGLDIDF